MKDQHRSLKHPPRSGLPVRWSTLLLASVASVAAGLGASCSGDSDDDDGLVVFSTGETVSGTEPIVVDGLWMVYLASEAFTGAGGTDLNGDTDTNDQVAVVVNMSSREETVLGVAAEGAEIVNGEVYLGVVEAADGRDWNGMNGTGDLVLLHWSFASGMVTFVDTLYPGIGQVAFLESGDRLYYSAEAMVVALPDGTSLRYVDPGAPTTPVEVPNEVGGGVLAPIPMAEDEGLLFFRVDEAVEGRDLNGDTDMTDAAVVLLLDGTDPAAAVVNTGLAVSGPDAPLAARSIGVGDWLVALLVSESDQGPTNFNFPGALPAPVVPDSCIATADIDMTDDVLFYLEYQDLLMGGTATNTGLAGRDRVLALNGAVATLSDEADASCDLNEDGDTTDTVVRWIQTTGPFMPPRDPSQLHAVATSVPGGSMGVVAHGNRLVCVVDEAADSDDLDGKAPDHDLVAWLDPAAGFGASWTFAHQSPSVPSYGTGVFFGGTSEPYAGTSWMAAETMGGRLPMTFLEEVPGTNASATSLNNNLACAVVAKDTDLTDALPVWADFEPGPTLDFDGLGYAVDPVNAGIVVAGQIVFFRVDEADDAIDHNKDGDLLDVVLMRNPTTSCVPVVMATSSGIPGPAVFTDGLQGGAFYTSEFQAGTDLNGDGDMADIVVQYFAF